MQQLDDVLRLLRSKSRFEYKDIDIVSSSQPFVTVYVRKNRSSDAFMFAFFLSAFDGIFAKLLLSESPRSMQTSVTQEDA